MRLKAQFRAPPPVFPAPLANITFTATGSGPSLALSSPGGYPDMLICRAAPPVPAGHTRYSKKSFKIIGTLPSLSTHTPITALFTAHYHAPGPGAALAIELIGVSASGLRTASLILTAVTLAAEDASALTLE